MGTLVACLGNELVGDDGVGVRVGRVLRGLELPAGVEVVIRPNLGLELIELLGEYERVLLVDAMQTGRVAGSCEVIDVAEAEGMASCPTCSHSIGIPEVLQLARRLHPDRALGSVQIIGVEGQSMDEFGVGLTKAVRAGMVRAVETVLRAVGASEKVCRLGRDAAEQDAGGEPTMDDVLGTMGSSG